MAASSSQCATSGSVARSLRTERAAVVRRPAASHHHPKKVHRDLIGRAHHRSPLASLPAVELFSLSSLKSPSPCYERNLRARYGWKGVRHNNTRFLINDHILQVVISSWRLASPRAENKSSLTLVSADRFFSRVAFLSCIAARADISTSELCWDSRFRSCTSILRIWKSEVR